MIFLCAFRFFVLLSCVPCGGVFSCFVFFPLSTHTVGNVRGHRFFRSRAARGTGNAKARGESGAGQTRLRGDKQVPSRDRRCTWLLHYDRGQKRFALSTVPSVFLFLLLHLFALVSVCRLRDRPTTGFSGGFGAADRSNVLG